jgi:hypothetical protein
LLGEITIEGRVWPYLVTTALDGDSYQEAYEMLSPTDTSHIATTLGIHNNQLSLINRQNGEENSRIEYGKFQEFSKDLGTFYREFEKEKNRMS